MNNGNGKTNYNAFLQSVIDDYRDRFNQGTDQHILDMQEVWGKQRTLPERITNVRACIDIHFQGQDHVACYRLDRDGLVFQGFES
jgi:hypothetical protein